MLSLASLAQDNVQARMVHRIVTIDCLGNHPGDEGGKEVGLMTVLSVA